MRGRSQYVRPEAFHCANGMLGHYRMKGLTTTENDAERVS